MFSSANQALAKFMVILINYVSRKSCMVNNKLPKILRYGIQEESSLASMRENCELGMSQY